MSYEDKYPHLHFDYSGKSQRRLKTYKILGDYELFEPMGQKQAHFIHKDDIELHDSKAWQEGTGICGREARKDSDVSLVIAKFVCEDCLKKMNKKMKKSLYDEENEEYYDPVEER